jgi:HAD superfamily hydrolase (TIGR01509 family)
MNGRRIAAVVFDLDGLLLDTERLYRTAFVQAASRFGFTVDPAFYATLIGLATPARIARLRARFGAAFPLEPFLADYYARKRRLLDGPVALKPGAAMLLRHLRARRVPTAVATSGTRQTAALNLARRGLAGRFSAVVTRDDVARGKPHPDPFLHAAQALRVPPSACLALEDSHHGILASHAAGMRAIMVPDLVGPTPAIRAKCAAVARDLHAVRRMLEGALPPA